MIYRQGIRCNIPRLTVTKITSYTAKVQGDREIVKWRYAFEQAGTRQRFVYTGTIKPFREGEQLDLRATIKREGDRFGFIRLAQIRRTQCQPELDL